MKFESINETERFDYKDCTISDICVSDKGLWMSVSALIVKATNSQNSNYTDSYAGDTEIVFENAQIEKLLKLGTRIYDANDVLLEEIADKELPFATLNLKEMFTNAYLTEISRENDKIQLYFEVPDEDPYTLGEEYQMVISDGDVKISWDKYMNRVQSM